MQPDNSTIYPLDSLPQTEEVKRLRDKLKQQEPNAKLDAVWPGSTIDWKSEVVPMHLYVELPFWLMMPEGSFRVKEGESEVAVEVIHACEEIQASPTAQTTHSSTVFISKPHENPPKWVEETIESPNGFSVRIHRTTLVFEISVLKSVLSHMREGSVLNQSHALDYLQALAVGHLLLVNKLLGAYRRVSYDPFVLEVTPATVPIWFYRIDDEFYRVSLRPYADCLHRPEWLDADGAAPANLANTEEVKLYLTLAETPGEAILLDAWSYFYEGRFNDAVRGLITSIEVLLEARFAEALRAQGMQEEKVQAELNSTAQKFLTRFKKYLHTSGRTIPGPLLSHVPYINGVRLHDELLETRRLRHKIVHEGERISPFEFGTMLRYAETMTWLFDWLDDNPRNSANRFRYYDLKTNLKGQYLLAVDYTVDGLRVRELDFGPPSEDPVAIQKYEENLQSAFADDILWTQHALSLFGEYKDLPLFVKMALTCVVCGSAKIVQALFGLNSGPLIDNAPPFPATGVTPERFLAVIDDVDTSIFVLDLDGEVELGDLSGILVRLLQRRVEQSEKRIHGICVVNHQRWLAPIMRQVHRKLDDGLEYLLQSCDLSLLFATDLARYVKGAIDHGWSLSPVREAIKAPGYVSFEPPNATYVGHVITVFPKRSVIGINADANPPLKTGERIVVRSNAGFEILTAESLAVNKQAVEEVYTGEAGIKVEFDVKKIIQGSYVFRMNPSLEASEKVDGE